ncbi:MAG TPA: hypothetical protein VHW06_13315 [Streptosporangiaceae bacterium]|nr:hypothetical protein [Streptosporangiaceae bacterium]
MATPDIDKAVQFLAANARVIDRRRYERLFEGGAAEPVRGALAAYRNPDGGFGQALEPDGRAPTSEPIAAEVALHVMDETDVWDDELVAGVLGWLAETAPAEGGVLFVHDGMTKWPHAPWLVPDAGPRDADGAPPASDIQTGLMAGTLHKRGVRHPWLDGASEVMWSRIDGLTEPTPYGMTGMLHFLQYVPDRTRARQAMDRLGPMILDAGIVTLDPDATGEVHSPLNFAPLPDSIARPLFDEAMIKAHLDHFAAGQLEDGGWTFNWLAWSPAAERDWRGALTVDALRLLRANGRL